MTTPDAALRLESIIAGLEMLRQAVSAGDVKRELLLRVDDLTKETRDLLALSAAPVGWALVPKEPTEAMKEAGVRAYMLACHHDAFYAVYRAMLAAAPSASPAPAQATEGELGPQVRPFEDVPSLHETVTQHFATPPAEAREPATEALLPCRQCNYSASPLKILSDERKHYYAHAYQCQRCLFQSETGATWDEARAKWNTRATPAPALVERARFLLDRLSELEITEDISRDWFGHVRPAMAQLLAALPGAATEKEKP